MSALTNLLDYNPISHRARDPLPIEALAALQSVPSNVFCNIIADLIVGGQAALTTMEPKWIVPTAATATLLGIVRATKSRFQFRKSPISNRPFAPPAAISTCLCFDFSTSPARSPEFPNPPSAPHVMQAEESCIRRLPHCPIFNLCSLLSCLDFSTFRSLPPANRQLDVGSWQAARQCHTMTQVKKIPSKRTRLKASLNITERNPAAECGESSRRPVRDYLRF